MVQKSFPKKDRLASEREERFGCPSGKDKYRTQSAAQRKIDDILLTAEPDRTLPVRSYTCEFCGYWHLTSKPWHPGGEVNLPDPDRALLFLPGVREALAQEHRPQPQVQDSEDEEDAWRTA